MSQKVVVSPFRQFLWAAAWFGIAALGIVVVALNAEQIQSGDFSGQRTFGIIVFTPVIALVIGLALLWRGMSALRPFLEYRNQNSEVGLLYIDPAQFKGQKPGFFYAISGIFFTIWLAGLTVLLIFMEQLSQNVSGLVLAVMLLAVLVLVWIGTLFAGLRRRSRPLA